MKKAMIIILILFLTSCSVEILDEEGWRIYQLGWSLYENQVLIQSHDGFMVEFCYEDVCLQHLYNEIIKETPTTVYNVLNRPIDVKITKAGTGSIYVVVPSNDKYDIL